jgi:hypothetical protein
MNDDSADRDRRTRVRLGSQPAAVLADSLRKNEVPAVRQRHAERGGYYRM